MNIKRIALIAHDHKKDELVDWTTAHFIFSSPLFFADYEGKMPDLKIVWRRKKAMVLNNLTADRFAQGID